MALTITSPNATLRLYNTKLIAGKNQLVEDLAQYLATCPASADFGGSSGFTIQWQRVERSKDIKLDLPEYKQALIAPNYCSIKDSNESATAYYFVEKIEQVAENTVRLRLALDILNTIGYKGGALYPTAFNANTHITRRHFDRFKNPFGGNLSEMRRNVLHYSQGFFPEMYRKSVDYIQDGKSSLNKDWYLIYASESGDAVQTFLAPGESAYFQWTEPSQATEGVSGANYYVRLTDQTTNKTVKLSLAPWTHEEIAYTLGSAYNFDGTNAILRGFRTGVEHYPLYDVNVVYAYYGASDSAAEYIRVRDFDAAGFTSDSQGEAHDARGMKLLLACDKYRWSVQPITSLLSWALANLETVKTTEETLERLLPAADLGRYNKLSTTQKIIKCAYCPIDIPVTAGVYDLTGIDARVVTGGSYNDLIRLNADTLQTFNRTNVAVIGLDNDLAVDLTGSRRNAARGSYELESQLYHSDTYGVKLCLNDENVNIAVEELLYSDNTAVGVYIDYMLSEAYGSTQAFKLRPFSGVDFDRDDDATNKCLICYGDGFNQTVYSSSYLDYMRQNYDYDRKSLKYSAINTIIGGASSLAGSVAAENPVGAGMTIYNTANALANNKRSFNHRMQLLQLQGMNALSVSGQDVSKFVYGTDRLRKLRYMPKDYARKWIAKVYYLTGLACDAYAGDDIGYLSDAVNGRYWWNFLQCEPVFELGNVPQIGNGEYLEDLKEAYRTGVTILHHRAEGWNVEQTKENWEINLALRFS